METEVILEAQRIDGCTVDPDTGAKRLPVSNTVLDTFHLSNVTKDSRYPSRSQSMIFTRGTDTTFATIPHLGIWARASDSSKKIPPPSVFSWTDW